MKRPCDFFLLATSIRAGTRSLTERLGQLARQGSTRWYALAGVLLLTLVLAACAFGGGPVPDTQGQEAPPPSAGPESGRPVPADWTALSNEELVWFNEEFFDDGATGGPYEHYDPSYQHNLFLNCVYEDPRQIDLGLVFFNGDYQGKDLNDDEWQAVGELWQQRLNYVPDGPYAKISAADMADILYANTGLTIDQLYRPGLDSFVYLGSNDAYSPDAYYDAYYALPGRDRVFYTLAVFDEGYRDPAGDIYLYGPEHEVRLTPDGQEGYWFISHTQQGLEAELIAQFQRAEAAIAWFSGRNVLATDNEEAILVQGREYRRVNDPDWPELTTLAALEGCLNTIFEPYYTQELLATMVADDAPLFVEEGGRLYIFGGYAAQLPYDIGERVLSVRRLYYDQQAYGLTLGYRADPWSSGHSYYIELGYTARQGEDGLWRFDHFHLPLERLLARAEFSLLIGGQPLTLGRQQGPFPWGTELTSDNMTMWSSDGFDAFDIDCQEGLSITGLRRQDDRSWGSIAAEDETDGAIISLFTTNPEYSTYRGVTVGMSEAELLEYYPEAQRQDWTTNLAAFDRTGLGQPAYSYGYVTPEEPDNMTTAILFGMDGGRVTFIYIADGMDGRPF